MNFLMVFVAVIVVFYVAIIIYAIKNAKKAYPGSQSSKKQRNNTTQTVINDDWEGGRVLPHKIEPRGKHMADIDLNSNLHDVSKGLDGVSYDYNNL